MYDNIILLSLPREILINILSYITLSDILNLMLTCKTMITIIVNESTLWRLISKQRFVLINKSDQNSFTWYNKCRIFHNWCKGIYKSKVIIQHKTNYMPWLHFSNSETLYLSVGSELRCYKLDRRGIPHNGYIWSFEVPIVKRSDARTNDISRFIVKDNIIICGNRDGCVAVYKLNDNDHKPNFLHHIKDCHEKGLEEVSAVEKVGNTIVTVSNRSDSICFWQLGNNKSVVQCNTMSPNISKIEYLLPNQICCKSIAANKAEDKLAVGPTGQDKPMIFDVNTGTFTMTSSSINYATVVRDIHWLNEHCVAYVTYSGKVQVFDIRSSNVVYQTTDPFLSSLYCLKTDCDRTIVTGSSEYTRCVLYDLRSKYHLQMYFTQKKSSPVYCLDFDSTKLIAAADRGVATLNFNLNNSSAHRRDYSQRFEYLHRYETCGFAPAKSRGELAKRMSHSHLIYFKSCLLFTVY